MSKSFHVFKNKLFGKVRVIDKKGEPWFLAKEICSILGLKNTSQAISLLDQDEKNTIILNEGKGNPNKTIINESGLYSLIMNSRKTEARSFKKWVTSEVLPSIRKTGKYKIPKKLRSESKDIRNSLTDKWKANGVEKSYHYINLTKEEYKTLFGDRNKKKDQMSEEEIIKLKAFEALESFKMLGSRALGYYGCKKSIHDTSVFLENFKTVQSQEGI